MPRLLSVQVGQARRVNIHGRTVLTAFYKQSVDGAVPLQPLGLQGDEQADPSVHGGLDKAVYAYPSEHYPFWQAQRADAGLTGIDDALPWGSLGENLTLAGVLERDVWVGDVLRFADCALRVTQPREPCYKFTAAIGLPNAARLMAQHACCGFYLAVEVPGTLAAGEPFELIAGPRRLDIVQMFNAKWAKHLG